ncbi:MAG: DUF1553 domain-containing protein, partial [Bryobacteraceae bacterium]
VRMLYDVIDEQIDIASKAFIGLTVACARCHDHKFDPISTKDYYSLAGIFASTKYFDDVNRPGGVASIHYVPLDPAAYERYDTHRRDMYAKQMETEQEVEKQAADWYVKQGQNIAANLLAGEGKWTGFLSSTDSASLKRWREASPETRSDLARSYQEEYLKAIPVWVTKMTKYRTDFKRAVVGARAIPERPKFAAAGSPFFAEVSEKVLVFEDTLEIARMRAEWKQLEKTMPEEPAMASGLEDGDPVEQKVFVRGDHHSPGDPVTKHFPLVIEGATPPRVAKGSGRLELAQWMTTPDHPLTARVMVNRVWQWHFGEGLVRTPSNWGTTGEKPTHPELLDYLARKFVESGWSIKALHRMILLSGAYGMESVAPQAVREADPENRLLSRFSRRRLTVEEIRDSYLALDGTLDAAMGGTLLPPAGKRGMPKPDDVRRRTVYVPIRRGSMPPMMSTFDYGDATTSSDGRSRTNVAPQALFMMNSSFVADRALGLAKNLLADATPSDAAIVNRAYLRVLGRVPRPDEIDRALSYTSALEKKIDSPEARNYAWQSFCRVLMASNEFVFVD